MKFSTVDSEVIRKHSTNNSPSKLAYQFPKTKRFPNPNPQCPKAFYSYKSQLSQRQAYIGFGNKGDFTKNNAVSPPSTKYDLKSIFEEGNTKGNSFGCARDKCDDRSYMIPQLQKIPGPGKYENQKETRMNTSYTMRKKPLDFIEEKKTNKYTPGPGYYNSIDMEPQQGRIKISKYRDCKFAKISSKPERFANTKESPGPQQYREGDSLSSSGKYVLSQRKGSGTRVFNRENRFTSSHWKTSNNPAPSQYDFQSEFGIYGDAKYYKTLQHFK